MLSSPMSHDPPLELDAAVIAAKVTEIVQEYIDDKIDITRPLHIQGIDSIANMELRQKLQVRSFFGLIR